MVSALVFEFEEYKPFLRRYLEQCPNRGYGVKSRLAKAAGCQVAYVARVLDGSAHLSLEQALAMTPEMGLGSRESDFFLLLVQHERASTPQLRAHFKEKLREARRRAHDLKERFAVQTSLSSEAQATYYSSWQYLAVHVALSIPGVRTAERISNRLNIPITRVKTILRFLVSCALAAPNANKGEYRIGKARLHLDKDAAWVARHHGNWRLQAMQSIERAHPDDFHYSAVVTVSEEDALQLRELWVRTLEQFNAKVAPSAEQTLRCLCLDFFDPWHK